MAFDPSAFQQGAEVANECIQTGVKDFAQFAVRMKIALGVRWDSVKRYLCAYWSFYSAKNPGFEDVTRAQAEQVIQDLDAMADPSPTADSQLQLFTSSVRKPPTAHSPDHDRSKNALDELFAEARAFRTSADFLGLFKFIRRFPTFAPYNGFLLHVQKPGAEYVASVRDWKLRFNRTIKPGARPLVILVPFGPVGFVYDLPDTEGPDPVPDAILNPFRTDGVLPDGVYDKTLANLFRDRVRHEASDMGNTLAGQIQPAGPKDFIFRQRLKPKDTVKLKALYVMLVNQNLEQAARYATLVHELGHLYCGHLGTPDDTWWPDRVRTGPREAEFEAESVAWLVCERVGIRNPSAEYLSAYLKDGRDVPEISIEAVFKAAGYIETMGERPLRDRKPLRPGEHAGRGVRIE